MTWDDEKKEDKRIPGGTCFFCGGNGYTDFGKCDICRGSGKNKEKQ